MNLVPFPIGPCVFTLVVVAMAYDMHARRIPNWLVATALAIALPVQLLANGMPSGSIWWIGGAATGSLLLIPGYLMRMLGAGDVKLMAAVGAFLGPRVALEAALATAAVVGVLALLAVIRKRRLRRVVASAMSMLITMSESPEKSASIKPRAPHEESSSIGSLPYGVAIAIGTVFALIANT